MPQAAVVRYQKANFQLMWLLVAGLLLSVAAPVSSFAQQAQTTTNPEASSQLFDGVFANDMAAVQAAISAGADLSVRNDWGLSAVELAVDKGYFEIAHYLLDVRNFRRQQALDQQQKSPIPEPFAARQSNDAPFEAGKARASPTPGVLSGPLPEEQASSAQVPPSPVTGPNPFDTRTATKGTPAITGQIQGPDLPPMPKESSSPASQFAPQSSIAVPEPPGDQVISAGPASPQISTEPKSVATAQPTAPMVAPEPVRTVTEVVPPEGAQSGVVSGSAVPPPPAPAAVLPKPTPPAGAAVAEAPSVAKEPLTSLPVEPRETPSTAAKIEASPVPEKSLDQAPAMAPASEAKTLPEASPNVASKNTVTASETVAAEAESTSVLGGLFDRLASILPDSTSVPDPEPETAVSKSEPTPEKSSADAQTEDIQVAAVEPQKPVAERVTPIPSTPQTRAVLKAHLGSNLPLGRPYQQSASDSCVQKERGRVAFCIEPVSWPSDIEDAFDVSTILYQGRQAIVRYDGGASTATHAMFAQESFDEVVTWARSRFGAPVSERTERIAMPGEVPMDNHVLLWRGSDPEGSVPTSLEIRRIDNVRTGFPDRRYGVIRIFRDSGRKVFPQLSTMDLMLMR